jgi:formylglycine-generating enzyme required for sulfatase activity
VNSAKISSGRRAAPPIELDSVVAGRYRLVAFIGEGGDGWVYRAIDQAGQGDNPDPNIIALKILSDEFDETAGHFAALSAQFSRWRRLQHPNIVRLFDCDRAGSAVFITMEYVAGESVYAKLHSGPSPGERSRPMDADEARPIIASVASALSYAHHQGVVHGDLKPGNIIVTGRRDVKVVDFGVTRWLSRPGNAEAISSIAATPRYASPQVIAGEKPKPCDDVYALACVAYEMLTGFHPFEGAADARVAGAPARRRGLRPGEHAAIVHALQSDPDKRAATIQEFIEEFSAPPRRSLVPWPVWLGAAAMVLVAWLYLRSPDHTHPIVRPQPSQPASPTAQVAEPSAAKPGTVIRDCADCPSVTVLPAGQFEQGADASERSAPGLEKPRHRVRINYPFAISTTDITVEDFQKFVAAGGRDVQGCETYDGEWKHRPAASWADPGFAQSEHHPVTCISWNDAVAYAEWLSAKSGHRYRLPSASEWEYAARAGDESARSWSADATAVCANANVADRSAERRFPGWAVFPCDDGYVYTAPAGSFHPNALGLQDMLGNVLVWTEDCWQADYVGSPSDGSPRVEGDCREHEVRGASWFTAPAAVSASYRNHFAADYRTSSLGFRLVREVQ